jgi:nitrate/TMAO reductase-like tetraheme cytochrome c subunit
MAGALLATVAGCSWLAALPNLLRGDTKDPYIGILLFVVLPAVLVIGLILMPIGAWRARREIRRGLKQAPTRESSLKRLAGFLLATTVVNVVIIAQVSYGAVQYMEGVSFCGTSCHVMTPEFTAYQRSPHARVPCVDCHVSPGAAGWVNSKMAGARQLVDTVLGTSSRPIKSAIETNQLVPSRETCEKCHWPDQFNGTKLRVIPEYADDETNSSTQTVLMMMVGGGGVRGIHDAHFGPGVTIRYASTDSTRQTIPWVEYTDATSKINRVYTASDAPADTGKLTRYTMQCVDCHNRPTHTFMLPERAMNRAMALGRISVTLPFIKKKGVEVLRTAYAAPDEARRRIPAALRDYYRSTGIYDSRSADVDSAANAIVAIYEGNVFPDLKVTWGTYKNNLGHTDFPGCFRCHDEMHATTDQKTITQDCGACHEIVSSSEASPEILQTLGVQKRLSAIQKR